MPPLCHDVTTAGLTAIPTLTPTTTIAPTAAPTYKTLSPTEATFPGICDDAAAVLNPRVASASFVDETVWIPRGVPSVAEFAEVAGGLSAYAFSYEPELAVSADVSARGLAARPSLSRGGAGFAGTDLSMPATCAKHTLAADLTAPLRDAGPAGLSRPRSKRRSFLHYRTSTDDPSALLKPHLLGCFEDPAVGAPHAVREAGNGRDVGAGAATTSPSC